MREGSQPPFPCRCTDGSPARWSFLLREEFPLVLEAKCLRRAPVQVTRQLLTGRCASQEDRGRLTGVLGGLCGMSRTAGRNPP